MAPEGDVSLFQTKRKQTKNYMGGTSTKRISKFNTKKRKTFEILTLVFL
jgi:hypothetical protein